MIKYVNWPMAGFYPVQIYAPFPQEKYSEILANAKIFQTFLRKQGSCLILTMAPNPHTSPIMGRRVAEALGIDFIFPEVDGIATFDKSHMHPESAEIWSSAFLEAAEDSFARCGVFKDPPISDRS